jgi:hypothetical protein
VVLQGSTGVLAHLERVVRAKLSAVVVIAEGAGQDLLPRECGLLRCCAAAVCVCTCACACA